MEMDNKHPLYRKPGNEALLESQGRQSREKHRTKMWFLALLSITAAVIMLYLTNRFNQTAYLYNAPAMLEWQRAYVPNKLLLNGMPIESLDGLQTSHSREIYNSLTSKYHTGTSLHTTIDISALQGLLNITMVPPSNVRKLHGKFSTPTVTKTNILRIRTMPWRARDTISIEQDISFAQTWNTNDQIYCRTYLGYICSLIYASAYKETLTSRTFVSLPRLTTHNLSVPDFTTLYVDVYDTNVRIVNTKPGEFSESIYINARGSSSVSTGTISSEEITIQSCRGPITGTFNTTSTLTISTSNAPITIEANLKSKIERRSRRYGNPGLIASTSNSPIEATINLFGEEKSVFTVSAVTSNSHVDLKFPIAPLNNRASIKAATTNGSATVVTHPTFQGPFTLLTTNSTTLLDQSRNTVDPTGMRRERQIDYSWYGDERTGGWVYWGEIGDEYEYYGVQVKTTNYPAVLVL